jgi:hypothetical protein
MRFRLSKPIRLAAALTLLVCLGWSMTLPIAAAAMSDHNYDEQALVSEAATSTGELLPRTGEGRELLRAYERSQVWVSLDNTWQERLSASGPLARRPARVLVALRSTYPARRQLKNRQSHPKDGELPS